MYFTRSVNKDLFLLANTRFAHPSEKCSAQPATGMGFSPLSGPGADWTGVGHSGKLEDSAESLANCF